MSRLTALELQGYRRRFKLDVFVETGCYQGDGIAAALDAGFETVRSCDLCDEHASLCRARFADQEDVEISVGESVAALRAHLEGSRLGPCLFWLDAHYPAYYGMGEVENDVTRFPAAFELALIYELRGGASDDVILVDDMRVIHAQDNPRWQFGEVDDYYRVDGTTLAGLTGPFKETHDVWVDVREEGILVLTPLGGCRALAGSAT